MNTSLKSAAILSVLMMFLYATDALATIQCYQCHGTTGDYRPLDSSDRNASSGGFQGNHRTHLAGPSSPEDCARCHPGSESYKSFHRDGLIKVSSRMKGSPLITSYNNTTSAFPQTPTPTPGACTNVNCHFESVTPTWGATGFASPDDCNKCHGAAPTDGSHPKHATVYGISGVTNSCQKCHADHTAEPIPFAHATSAGNRSLWVSFAAAPNNGTGSYSGDTSYPNYLPSSTPARNGTCDSIYCHGASMVPNNGSDTTPVWGTASTGQCGTCHGATAAVPPVRGSHRTHAGSGEWYHAPSGLNDKILGRGMPCGTCHKTASSQHVNGNAEWSFNSLSSPRLSGARYRGLSSGSVSPVPSAAYGQCSNLYCHSIIQTATGGALTGLAGEYKTVTWGNMDEGTCGSCHAVDLGHATWAGRTTAPEITTGSHAKHLTAIGANAGLGGTPGGPARCAVCHNYGNSDDLLGCSTVCHNAQPSQHVNHRIEVRFAPRYDGGSAAYTGSPVPGSGFGGCTTTYCHSNGLAVSPTYSAPTWGNPASSACGSCHGATAAAPPASTRHGKHVGSSSPYAYACAICHAGIVKHNANATTYTVISSGTANSGAQLHVDKSREVRFDTLNPFGNYSSANLSCNSAYCHSIGNASVASGSLPAIYNGKIYAKPKWTDAGPLACNACHGRSTPGSGVTYGMPDYTNGGVGNAANSHLKHVSAGNISCVECHEKTTKKNTTIRATFPGKHVDGTSHDVYFNLSSLNKLGTYDSGAKTCSSTYCHGAGPSAAWGSPTLPCNSCHSANSTLPGAHQIHVQTAALASSYANMSGNVSSASQYRFSCAACHQPGTGKASHANGPQTGGINGPGEIFYGFTSASRKGSYTYGGTSAGTDPTGAFSYTAGGSGCETTYCHSNGAGAVGARTVSWSATASSATDIRCKSCHNYTTASGAAIATGEHTVHVNGSTYNISCRKCHAATTTDGTSITDKAKHVNKLVNVAYNNTTTAVGGTYNGIASPMTKNPGSAYGNCTNTYCHSKGTSTTPSTPNIVATWGGTLNTSCSGCHGGDSTATYKMGSVGSVSHNKHVLTYTYGCVKCHAATVSDNRTISNYANHVNRQVNIAFNNSTTAVNGTYAGSVTPMTKLPGSTFGICNNTYCHSTVQADGGVNAPLYGTPTWGVNPGACSLKCHRVGTGHSSVAADGSTDAINTGSHTKHLAYSFNLGTDLKCPACHMWDFPPSTTSCRPCHEDIYTGTTTRHAKHVNGKIDIAFDPLFTPGKYAGTVTPMTKSPRTGYNNCADTYCHSNGTSVATGTIPANTTPTWGSGAIACNGCHGNATYGSDFRKAAPLYATGSPKGNAHPVHIRTGSLSGTYMQCLNCHAATTQNNTSIANTTTHVSKGYNIAASVLGVFSSAFRDGDNTMNSTKVTINYSYNASGSSCSNVSCHPIGLNITTAPPTPKTRATSSIKWNSSGVCIDCHNIDMQSTSTFHHAMRNYSSGYPLQAPYSSASTGLNTYARRCTMCHVDHNIFSNDLNSSNSLGRAANLRTDIAVAPTASSGYSNKDYIKSSGGTGGICISCHSTAKTKDTTRRLNDYPATATPVITQAQYSASGHQYDVSAKFMSDGSAVYGNCSKCHNALLNETSVFMNATSTYQFGNHNSGIRRLQGSLDAAGGETAEEQICYRCHSLIADADPGGGPPKAVADKDFYGVAPMSLAAQDIFTANLDFRPANPTYSTTSKLYFKPTAAENPAEPMPNQHNTGDTFAGGTWIGRSMSPWETTTTYETKSQDTNLTGTNYWQMVSFTSPTVYSTTTVPAGNWVINIYCRESSTYQNARIRYKVYKWNSNDTIGTTIIATGTNTTELVTTAAPGAVRQIALSVGITTLTAGEKIVVDLELDTSASYSTTYTGSFYFGSRAPSNLTLPGDVNWTYADPGAAGFGHRVQHYTGIHLPSTRNETLAYIAQNRHVECVDCHNPHATSNGLHGDYGIATGGSSTTLVNSNKNWIPNQWAGEYVSLVSSTLGTTTPVATITSNTATTLTTTPYSGTWVAPVAGNTYRIIANTNRVSRTQRGVPGASVSYSGAWANGTYSMVNEATYEYEICFKCHAATDATTNTMRYWNVTSASLGAARWTNIGLEFNPNNASYHPVIQPLPATGNRRLTAAALTGGWAPGEVMSCSDCHGRDTGNSATAQGPHGSTVKWMLTGKYQNWPFTSAAANGTAAGGTLLTGTGASTYPASNFCFNCHTWAAGGNAHVKSTNHIEPCVTCHIRVPHGGKVPRLLTGTNAPSRYKPNGSGGGGTGYYLTSARLPATGYMLKTDISCSRTCGQHPSFPVSGGSYW